MGVTAVLIICIASTAAAFSKTVQYQPIKITVNENFINQPNVAAEGWPSLSPGLVHQGTNFYFNPLVQLPLGVMPPHIETLLASLQKTNESCLQLNKSENVINKEDKTLTDVSSANDFNIKEDDAENTEVTKLPELKPIEALPELAAINQIGVLADLLITKPIKLVSELPSPKPVEIFAELPIPEPIKSSTLLPEPNPIDEISGSSIPELTEVIVELPVLEVTEEDHIKEILFPVINKHESIIEEVGTIPKAPVLPPLPVGFLHPATTEHNNESKNGSIENAEKPLHLEEEPLEDLNLTTIPAIPPAPELQSILIPGMQESHLSENDKPQLLIEELVSIQDSPLSSSNLIPSVILENVKHEEPIYQPPIFVEESIEDLFSATKPLFDPIVVVEMEESLEKDIIEENSVALPPVSAPLSINNDLEIVTEELEAIPDAPTLPPYVLEFQPPVRKEVIIEETANNGLANLDFVKPIFQEESVDALRPIKEIPTAHLIQPIVISNIGESKEIVKPNIFAEDIFIMEEKFKPAIFKPQIIMQDISKPLLPADAAIVTEVIKDQASLVQRQPVILNNILRPMSLPFPTLSIVLKPTLDTNNKFAVSTSCAHDIVNKRIAPNMMMMRRQSPKRLKLFPTPTALHTPV